MALNNGEWIQIGVAIIMLISTMFASWFSYWNIKTSKKDRLTSLFNQIVQQDNEMSQILYQYYNPLLDKAKSDKKAIEIKIEADKRIFDFYEYVIALYYQEKIDFELFEDYFESRIGEIYEWFMDSYLFEKNEEKHEKYPYICSFYNDGGLSIKEKSLLDENAK